MERTSSGCTIAGEMEGIAPASPPLALALLLGNSTKAAAAARPKLVVAIASLHRLRPASRLSGSSGKSRGYWRASDAGLAAWTVSAAMSPAEGVTMGVPVDSCLRNRMGDILPSLEALPGQRQ